LELALEQTSSTAGENTHECFNPCFLGTGARTSRRDLQGAGQGRVSILVFLELALEQLLQKDSRPPISVAFQSLFSWNWRSNFIGNTMRYSIDLFQSLFSWNWRSNAPPKANQANVPGFNPCFLGTGARTPNYWGDDDDGVGFQSLFSWNWRSNRDQETRQLLKWFVSILVFLELALELWDLGPRQLDQILFQSLFSWNWRSNVTWPQPTAWYFCFNPCFLGTGARTLQPEGVLASASGFQSLFSWNWRSNLTELLGRR